MSKLRKHQFLTILALLLIIVSSTLVGCGPKETAQETPTVSEVPKEQTITDQAGRKVTIPTKIDKVYYTSPIGQIMVYVLAPDKMAGWSMQLADNEMKYIMPKYRDLPYLGGTQMNAKINTEELLKVHPDLIFNVGPDPINAKTISESDKLQQQLNIPVVVVDGDIENTEKALAFMGHILGAEKKAREINAYCQKTMNEVMKVTKAIPEDKRARVYYAEGPKGLATEPSGSSHAEVLDILNLINVAECKNNGGGGMSNVSLEQVLKWNPDVIISWGAERGGAYDKILSSPDWKNIKAVKNQQVYEIPNYPFNWFDRPPSISRYLGLKWVTATVYPDYYKVDMVKEVKDFYKLFYHIDISDADAKSLLKTSLK